MRTTCIFFMLSTMFVLSESTLAAEPAAITANVTVSPPDKAKELKLTDELADQTLLSPITKETTPISLSNFTQSTPTRRALFVVWSDESETTFPIMLASVFSGRPFDIYFIQKGSPIVPSDHQVAEECDSGRPASIKSAFRMYYVCKDYTMSLEDISKWQKSHRTALSGWFTANYYLYTKSQPLSPYAFDEELQARLADALALVKNEGYRQNRLAPLRIPDIEQALREVEAEPLRAVGYVPNLIKNGKFTAARDLNDAALSQIDVISAAQDVSSYGVSRDMLKANRALIENISPKF